MSKLTITVQDSESAVLSGVAISYAVSGVALGCITDTVGQVEIEGLAAETYTFTATLDGYTSATADITLTDSADATGTITMTKEVSVASVIVSAVAAVAVTTLTEKVAALKVKLNAKIAATSNVWKKLGYQVLLIILNTGSEEAVTYVTKKIS